jgi:RNA polymerase sigma-70 factor, ECF subfamily
MWKPSAALVWNNLSQSPEDLRKISGWAHASLHAGQFIRRYWGAMTFAQMVESAVPALRRYARGLTHDRDIADDIVQETVVRALRSEHLFQGTDARAWLYTILTNLNRNRLRALARRPPLSPIQENDACDFSGPELGSRDITRAIASLAEEQRSTLLLVVLEGLSYRDVAEVQAVPLGTVTSRMARARAHIKNYLDGERPALRRVK